jgi:alkylation response protein AidB-like acyl-CoA dehydrogenase
MNLNYIGPLLMRFGTPDQRAEFLPPMARGDALWTQLFSEPDAGSDLASLRTRARDDGDHFVVTGQKIWSSYADAPADWGLLLARTDPDVAKHAGISVFLLDMTSPGVTVRPIPTMAGPHEFNEVFFDDVVVPDDCLIGPLNEGWRVSSSTLTHERGTNPRQLVLHIQLLEELLRLALESGAYDDHRLGQRLAQAYVEVRLFQLHNWRSLSRLEHGRALGPEGSALKLYWSEMSKRLHDTAMAVLGPAAPLWRDADGNPGDGRWQRSWLYYQSSSIFAGTNEIQRNIIGERVLGLPR